VFHPPSPGGVCYLDGLFTDWTPRYVIAALRAHDDRTDAWFNPIAT